MKNKLFNKNQIVFKNLKDRKNQLSINDNLFSLDQPLSLSSTDKEFINNVANKIKLARQNEKSVILAFGAHTIKNGLSPILISLIENNYITHLATNGAGVIHDWEFAFQGETGEDVKENLNNGTFGLWQETNYYINLALAIGAFEGLGYGESIGKMIYNDGLIIPTEEALLIEIKKNINYNLSYTATVLELLNIIKKFNIKSGFMKINHKYPNYSVLKRAWELQIPFTCHPMFGHDIIYSHPLNNGAMIGKTAEKDFLCFVESVNNLDGGVYISLGSAVMSPMIFEKSIAMVQNKKLIKPYIFVVDILKSNWNWNNGEPEKNNSEYYSRQNKTFSRINKNTEFLTANNKDFLIELKNKLKY